MPGPASTHDQAAIHVVGLDGYVAGTGRGQEYGHGGDILGLVYAAQGDWAGSAGLCFFAADALGLVHGGEDPFHQIGACHAGTDRVDRDVMAGQLLGRCLGQGDDGAFGGGIGD